MTNILIDILGEIHGADLMAEKRWNSNGREIDYFIRILTDDIFVDVFEVANAKIIR